MYEFPKLKGIENYEKWSDDMTIVLKMNGLWWVTSGKLEKPVIPPSNATTADEEGYARELLEWEDKNMRACGMIKLSTERGPRIDIRDIEIATQIWSILKDRYEPSKFTTLYLAWRRLTQSRQSDFKSVQDYADSLKLAASRCSKVGEEVPDWLLSHLFLLGLNEGLEPYVFSLIQTAKINKAELAIDEMAVALVDHERMSNQEESYSSKSTMARFGKKSQYRNHSKSRRVRRNIAPFAI